MMHDFISRATLSHLIFIDGTAYLSTMQEMKDKGFHDLRASSLSGEDVDFSSYEGKVVLVVNTASKCGFTPQYEGLETLYRRHKDKGLEILGFPCNQFLNQEPGDAESIRQGCLLNYGVSFPMFAKINVNGPGTHPVFAWLKDRLKGRFGSKKVKWNFTKFLVDGDGNPVKRYSSATKPEDIEEDIIGLLEKK